MNNKTFYDRIRASLFGGKVTAGQVQGIESILSEWIKRGYCDLRKLAYILATTLHETARTMQPISEYGKGKGKPYGKKIKMSGKAYTKPDKIFYGRSFIQLTWFENYDKMGKHLGIDLLNYPEKALELNTATQILFEGMINGMFTGKKLEDYFSETKEDFVNARRIVNSLDKASLIAGYAKKFWEALKAAT